MAKKFISILLITALIFTTIDFASIVSYASGTKTKSSTVVDFDALQNACTDTTDTDNDGIYDEVEKILGLNLNSDDTDSDGLDDYFEIINELDPLSQDTNLDGVNDMYEMTRGEDVEPDVSLDSDGDNTPNVSDDDNDGDDIPDYIDISPFSSMGPTEKQSLEIIMKMENTFVNIQLRPEDVDEIIEYGRSMTWPEDVRGQVQNIDNKKDNFNIKPCLRITKFEDAYFSYSKEDKEKYGYISYNDAIYIPIEKLEYEGNYLGYQGTIFIPKEASKPLNDGRFKVDFDVELSYLMMIKNDYLGQKLQASHTLMDHHNRNLETGNYEPVKLENFDETRDRQFLNTAIGDITGDDAPDLVVFYLEEDNISNGEVTINYDVYERLHRNFDGTYGFLNEAIENNSFVIPTGFSSVNKEEDGYTYMSRYDFDIIDGEIICYYIDGRDTATVYKANSDGTVIDTGMTLTNGQREYFISHEEEFDKPFIGSNITDGAGYYKNNTYFYLYSRENPSARKDCDATYLVVKKEGEPQKEILVDNTSNLPMYKYYDGDSGPQDGAFADTELSTSLGIYDVTQDGKDDLVMLSYRYGTNERAKHSELYFISDIFHADLDTPYIVRKLELGNISSNEGYARSMDIADMDDDGMMDIVIVNSNKIIQEKGEWRKISDPYSFQDRYRFASYDEMNLSFDIDISYGIISREEIILEKKTDFEITGVNIESQKEIDTRIFSHEEDELMLGISQAFEFEFVNTSKSLYEALSTVKEKMGLDENGINLTTHLNDDFDNYDDAVVKVGKTFNDMLSDYNNRAFILAMEKQHRFKNLDEQAVINADGNITFDIASSPLIISKDMSLKWIYNDTLASPQDIVNMIDNNPEHILYFNDYKGDATEDLLRLNVGSTNITSIGGEHIMPENPDYTVDYMSFFSGNPELLIYGSGKIPSSGVSGYVFVATRTIAKAPKVVNITYKTARYVPGGGDLRFGSKAQLAKYSKFKMIGNVATGVGLVVDIAFSCYNGYMYGQDLEALGADDGTVAGAQIAYSVLYSAKAVITTVCITFLLSNPIGWIALGAIVADMVVGFLTDGKYGNYFDKWVKSFYDYRVYEGTYISTFDIVDKDITRSNDGYFTWAGDTYNEDTTYKTIISAKENGSPADTKKALDDCWIQIYDKFDSNDADIDNSKEWSEEFYEYKKKWCQKRYFYFDNTATFDEVGRNVLIDNDVTYKYKIITYVTQEEDNPFNPFDEDDTDFHYNDHKKVYKLNNRDIYFDVLPTSFEMFFEMYALVDGTHDYAIDYKKNELGCSDIDGDGLYVDDKGNEIDNKGNILTSESDKFDTDRDGLSDYLEVEYDSDPLDTDSDDDGLDDFEEFKLGTSLTDSDTDGDGIDDYTEVNTSVHFTALGVPAEGYSNPLLADTDGDLLSDAEERQLGTNPASMFTNGGDLFDGNSGAPVLSTDFDDYYSMTEGESLTIDFNDHFTDDNELIFITDYGSVDEDGIFTYTYDKARDGVSIEVEVIASDSRNGILETTFLIREDSDSPFITGVKLNNTLSKGIENIHTKADRNSEIEIVFNEEIDIRTGSAITITPIDSEHLDVNSSGDRLGSDCTVSISSTTTSAIIITRNDGLVENNITYRIDIHSADIKDTNGNLLDRDYEITFEMEDNIGPEIISVSNAVGIDSPLVIEFNEAVYMKPNAVYSDFGGGSYVRTTSGKSLYGYMSNTVFTADVKPNHLDSNTSYSLDSNTNKFWDLSGNVFSGCDSIADGYKTFVTDDVVGPYTTLTKFTLDTLVPHLYKFCFETDIVDGIIRIPFDEAITEGIDYSSIALSYENNLYFYGSDSAEKRIKEEASKYVLPFTSYIDGNELVIIPENYDPTMNYSVFVEPKSVTDLKGSPISEISDDYRLRILAKSPGVTSSTTGTNIVGLLTFNSDMSKANLVSKGLRESAVYTDSINASFNEIVVQNPMGSLNAISLTDQDNNTINSNKLFTGASLAITPDKSLSEGEYTITIPANTFIGVGELSYTFKVENEIDIEITEGDIGGTLKVHEKVFLTADYLENALSQDKNLTYQWYRSNDENYHNAVPIANANSYEYVLTGSEEGKYLFVSVKNDNVFEVSPAIGAIEGPYNNYCDIDHMVVEYDEANLITYDSSMDTYNLTVSAEKERVDVSAEFDETQNMKVYINDIEDFIWKEDEQMTVPLSFGDNEIIVEAVAENREDTKTYTINITRDESLGAENLKPKAKKVSIKNPNDNYVGQTLVGSYEYQDDLSRPEGKSIFKWYRRKNNATEEIQSANSYEYTVKSDDVGYALIFSITPKTETDITGDEISSNYTGVVTDNTITYTVTFEENGGSIVSDITDVKSDSTIDEPTEPTRRNYTFIGWYSDSSLTTLWDFDNDVITDNTTLYARWDYTPSSSGGLSSGSSSSSLPNAEIVIPESKKGEDVSVTVKQGNVVIIFNGEDFVDLGNKTVGVKIEKASKDSLDISDELKEQIGDLPIYDISVFVDGKKTNFESDEPIIIEISIQRIYDEHKIIAVYVDKNGETQMMESVAIDGIMRFGTNHLSHYALMYVDKSFEDITAHWGKIAIEALSSREVIKGKSEAVFDTEGEITRAEFVTLMVRYFDLTAHGSDLGYTDVESGSWYEEYVWTAKEVGLLPEIYGDTFEPNKAITREEMMYILYRALEVTKKLDNFSDNGDSLSDFTDSLDVSDYVKEEAEYLISRDIINGSNNNMINPTNTSSRAEVAQMLWNMINMSNYRETNSTCISITRNQGNLIQGFNNGETLALFFPS